MRSHALTRAITAMLLLLLCTSSAALSGAAAPEHADPLASLLQPQDAQPPPTQQQQQQPSPPQHVSDVTPPAVESAAVPLPSSSSAVRLLRTPVPRVSAAEFEALVHGDLPVLVEFMAPWCHYCKQMAPLYEEAAVQMKTQPIPTQLVIVDCMIERALCARFHIGGFPSIRLIRKADTGSGLVVFPFEQSRTTLSFLVFCSTMWRTLQPKPFPELEPAQAQWMKEAWAAQQDAQANTQQQQQQQLPGSAQPSRQSSPGGPADANPDRSLGGLPGSPSLDTLAELGKKINLGTIAARHGAAAIANANAAGTVGGQKPGSIQYGVAAPVSRGGGFFSSWVFLLMLSVLAFAVLSLLCVRFGPLLRSKASRHHSLQLSKNF